MTPASLFSMRVRKFRPSIAATTAIFAIGACASNGNTGVNAHNYRLPSASDVALREQTADQQVQQVLNRLAFGPRPGDAAEVRAIGVDRWVARQLDPDRISDAPTDSFVARFPTIGKTGDSLLAEFPPAGQLSNELALKQQQALNADLVLAGAAGGIMVKATPIVLRNLVFSRDDSVRIKKSNQESNRVANDVATVKVARAVISERQLNEVMVDFWENHFSVFAGKDRVRYFLPEYDADVIRPHVLGKFRDLLGAVAKSSAMLYYLDQWQSVADSGRPTLASAPRVIANDTHGKHAVTDPRLASMSVGQLMDQKLMPKPLFNRFSQLSPERLNDVRKLNIAQANVRLNQFAIAQGKRRPRGLNENYARELMELHTLGVDGGYTQHDVIEVARALTGWTIAKGGNGGGFVFRGELHDAGEKTILGVAFPAGRGIEDGEELLDLLARSPATAKMIATKLARRFVSDSPPPALVARAAATFTRTDGDIRETMRTILTSPEFFSAAAFRSKVKSPFELVASTMRAMGAPADSSPRIAQFVNRLGEPIFGHLTPEGYPEFGTEWMNTGAILNRINFGMAAAGGRVPGIKMSDWPETKTLAIVDRNDQVDGVIRTLLGGSASPDTRDVLLTGTNPFLQSQVAQDTLAAMTKRDSNSSNSSNNTMATTSTMGADRGSLRMGQRVPAGLPAKPQTQPGRVIAKPGQAPSPQKGIGNVPNVTGLAQIVGLALGAPEFQRR
jgi:uncharacterized protein (DUF1800 family)